MSATVPLPSATVILMRERASSLEVLMLRRADTMGFVGGMWVFPGGRVDASDRAAAAHASAEDATAATDLCRRNARRFHTLEGGFLDSSETLALHLAACRETEEESGIRLAPLDLVYFGHWITPPVSPQRFDTRFFVAAMPEDQSVALDARESTAHAWVTPESALAGESRADALPPPTYLTLKDLATTYRRRGSLPALLRGEALRDVPPILPATRTGADAWEMLMPWDPEYGQAPGGHTVRITWPQHLLDLPGRLFFEGKRMRTVPTVREDAAP